MSPINPAVPGEFLTIYGTGIGSLTVMPPTGDRAPVTLLAEASEIPKVTLGGTPVEVSFAGLTPGAVGLAQFNIKLPVTLPQKDSLALVITFGNASSQPVNLALRAAGAASPGRRNQIVK